MREHLSKSDFLAAYHETYRQNGTLKDLSEALGLGVHTIYARNQRYRASGEELPRLRRGIRGHLSAAQFREVYGKAVADGKRYQDIQTLTGMTRNAIKVRAYSERQKGHWLPKLKRSDYKMGATRKTRGQSE